jgi:GNAT superfamily N-acetyltransferase
MKTSNPLLPLGYSAIPGGALVNAVTCLDMRARPPLGPAPEGKGLSLVRWPAHDLSGYRALYRRVGEDFLWTTRLEMSDVALADVLANPEIESYALRGPAGTIGLLELDFSVEGECEIVFFGVVADAIGTGSAWYLMFHTLDLAWRPTVDRVWLHTCHFDHPKALAFYQRAGFRPYAFLVEVIEDPRLSGILPRSAAPQVPLAMPADRAEP